MRLEIFSLSRLHRVGFRVIVGSLLVIGTVNAAEPPGFVGAEPAPYDVLLHVDGSTEAPGIGQDDSPFLTISDAVSAAKSHLDRGQNVEVKIRAVRYNESLPTISSSMAGENRERNENAKIERTWFKIGRWGDAGDVIISGSDDWSAGRIDWKAVRSASPSESLTCRVTAASTTRSNVDSFHM